VRGLEFESSTAAGGIAGRRRHGRAGRWWLTRSSGRDAHDESSRVAATAEAADRPSAAGACSCCCLRTGSRQPGACCCSRLRATILTAQLF
uniref:Uncharacterized protein n=1 Tax=Oryza glaberrima TaxID=4538 RepID=I1Q8L9_ORYGL